MISVRPENAKLLKNDTLMRQTAATIQSQIAHEWIELRKKGRAPAAGRLQNLLMQNSDVLTAAGIMSYDQLIETVMKLEGQLSEEGPGDQDPLTRLEEWLTEPLEAS